MRKTCLGMVYELAKEDARILFIGSDLGAGVLEEFRREMPNRFFMEGIAEANTVGMAAGLALEGKIPYVNTIASFITRRCFEQIVIDVCLHRANVRLIGNGGGMVYAPLGPTHQTVEDMAILRALPHMTVLAPADANEMKQLMPLTVNHPGPIYIRLAKGYDPVVTPPDVPFEMGKGKVLRTGKDVLILTTGVMPGPALEAAGLLENKGIAAGILHLPTIKPFDTEKVLDMAGTSRAIVTVEEHSLLGGLGSAAAEVIAEAGFNPGKRFRRMGIPDVFPEGYGSQADLLERYGLTAESISTTVQSLLKV